MEWILANWGLSVAILGGVVALTDRIVAWSPTKKDDLVWTPIKKVARPILRAVFPGKIK